MFMFALIWIIQNRTLLQIRSHRLSHSSEWWSRPIKAYSSTGSNHHQLERAIRGKWCKTRNKITNINFALTIQTIFNGFSPRTARSIILWKFQINLCCIKSTYLKKRSIVKLTRRRVLHPVPLSFFLCTDKSPMVATRQQNSIFLEMWGVKLRASRRYRRTLR